MHLEVSKQNTEGKYPEYHKVWEDEQLVITTIFGKADSSSTSPWDAGVSAYKNYYNKLLQMLGQPYESNLRSGEQPGLNNPEVRMKFRVASGTVDVHIYMIDGIREVGSDFIEKYNERTRISDFIAYNGHSGLGANIRALARMGKFEKGQYQIFFVNGCDTFAYVDNALRDAHHAVNPNEDPDKYIDVITNAMPAFFSSLATANAAIVEGLIGQEKTYREILAGIDGHQRVNVTGEQDNAYPEPF